MKTETSQLANTDMEMNMNHPSVPRFRWLSLLVLALLLAGCARDKLPDPTPVELLITASPSVNPDRNDRPSPILVRVYELRSAGAFETADFFGLLEQDQAVLGGEMINRWEFQLDPGETTRLDASFQAASSTLGIVAAYRDIEQAKWRAVMPLRSGRKNELSAMLGQLEVSIAAR